MLSIPFASTQTEFKLNENKLPRLQVNENLARIRRSSLKPYYYNNIGDICSNPLPSMITCSTSPKSPLKYRETGSKFDSTFLPTTLKKPAKKDFSFTQSTLPLKTSLNSKEVFVIESSSATNSEQFKGFYYLINRNSMTRAEKHENFASFLLRCKYEFNRVKKFKYIFSVTGKLYQFLQDFPYNEKIVIVSHSMLFGKQDQRVDLGSRSILSQIEEKFSNKTSNLSCLPPEKPAVRAKSLAEQPLRGQKCTFNQLKVKLGQTAVQIDTELPKLFDLGMQKMKSKCSFSESEIHKLYAKFKMLLHLSIAKNTNHSIWAGISKDIFIESYHGSDELKFVLGRIFDCIDQDCSGTISWEEYLVAMDIMCNGTYEQQIDLFFTVYDTDGNGSLSFEEIRNLCKLQLQNSDADNVIEELSQSFASLIFDITETPYDKEIPAEKIKQVLTRQTDKSLIEMFCSFSFMNFN